MLLRPNLLGYSLIQPFTAKTHIYDHGNKGCKADEDTIRWLASMTLYTLCFAVCLAHKVRPTIDGWLMVYYSDNEMNETILT